MRKERKKRVIPLRTPKAPAVKYRRTLDLLVKKLKHDVNTQIVPLLRQLQSEYVTDVYAKTLEEAFNSLRRNYVDINEQAKIVSASFVNGMDTVNKNRFYKSVDKAIGIDLQSVVQNEGLEDILVATTRENVSLIRSIPEEYFKNIESIVFSGTTQGRDATSMISQIIEQGDVSTRRAKLIARDQSSKLNSALNQKRQDNLGIKEYIWRTGGDGRVRSSHSSKNGKVFRWDDPPKDTGHPGQDIQCRCVAQAIINV